MWVGVGRQPWRSVVDSAQAKRFGVSQVVLRRGDQGDKEIGHERLPWSGPALVGALSDGAEQGSRAFLRWALRIRA